MPPVGFEPAISAGERPQTYVLDRADTEIGHGNFEKRNNVLESSIIIINYCIIMTDALYN